MVTLVYQANYDVFLSFTHERRSATDPHHLTKEANPDTRG